MPLQTLPIALQSQIIHSNTERVFNVFGSLHQYLVAPHEIGEAFAFMRVTVAPKIAIPLHSHGDPEVFYILEGAMEVLQYEDDSGRWVTAGPGDTVCVPGDVKHALRNRSSSAVTLLLVSTPRIYDFFRELGKPYRPGEPAGPPTPEDLQRLQALAAKYNYWIASPEENAEIGLTNF